MHKKLLVGILCAAMAMSAPGAAFATEIGQDTGSAVGSAVESAISNTGEDGPSSAAQDPSSNTGTEDAENGSDTSDQSGSDNAGTGKDASAGQDADGTDSSDGSSQEDGESGQDSSDTGNGGEDQSSGSGQDEQVQEAVDDATENDTVFSEEDMEALIEASTLTNEELIASQDIQEAPEVPQDFRFFTIPAVYGFAAEDTPVYEEESTGSKQVGALPANGLCFQLKEDGDWLYIESGEARGFIPKSALMDEDSAKALYQRIFDKAQQVAVQQGTGADITQVASLAQATVPYYENAAFNWYRGTSRRTVVTKEYALALQDVTIRQDESENAAAAGTLPKGGLCYILERTDDGWCYVESGDVRGFVPADEIEADDDVDQQVASQGEDAFTTASESVDPEDNKALYYTTTSVKTGAPDFSYDQRNEIVQYAKQFIGGPYVWGGTSLTNGCDCSGFVQQIYAHFGYTLPRTSMAQCQVGTKIPVSEALPGDLIFYARNGIVCHVVLYAGAGTTVEAASESLGICSREVHDYSAVWATRVIQDQVEEAPEETDVTSQAVSDGQQGQDLGLFTVSYFTGNDSTQIASSMLDDMSRYVSGDTILANAETIPAGTKVIVDGHVFTVKNADIGKNEVRIYTNDESLVLQGDKLAHVYAVQ